MRKTQLELLKKQKSAYGGSLYTTRAARNEKRQLAVRNTMHLVLRSSKALGAWSLTEGRHEPEIRSIVKKFAERFGVRVLSLAVVGNHLHFQLKLSNRFLYTPFIRAVSAAIAMAVTGVNKWTKQDGQTNSQPLAYLLLEKQMPNLLLARQIANRAEPFGKDGLSHAS